MLDWPVAACVGGCCLPGCRLWCLFVLCFLPRGVLDRILNLIESVSEGFPSYSFTYHLILKAWVLFFNSTVKVQESQAYRNMEVTREGISITFDPRDMLSVQTGFGFVRAAVAWVIVVGTSGFEPSSETTAPRYLKLITVPSFCPFTLISL